MRLLLAEDDPTLQANLKAVLTSAGFAVDATGNGIEAQHLGDQEPYDLVVLDLGLPERSGLDVLRHWRARRNPVPVLVLTARDAWHERVDGFKAGCDDYLGKPFHMEELVARVNALLRRSTGQPEHTLRRHGLALDEDRQTVVTEDGRELELTAMEFRLLRYFMRHPGQVLSKTRLADHVYEFDAERDSNVIEVYLNRLRRKLGKAYFETRRGQGYVFGPPK